MVQVSADLDSRPSVRVLARLDDPHRVAVPRILHELWLRRGVPVDFNELLEFPVVFALFDVEGQGHVVERIEPLGLVKHFHVIEYRLLVAQMEIVLLVIRGHHVVIGVVLFLLVFLFLFLRVSAQTCLSRGFVPA